MPIRLADLLSPPVVDVALKAASRDEVLARMIDAVARRPAVQDAGRLASDVAAREARLSTGVGGGLALPHARSPAVTGTVAALATLAAPVEWDAIDEAPVEVVLLLAGPESERSAHVHVLAHVSRVLSVPGLRDDMAAARTPEALLAAVVEAEHGVR